MVIAAPFITASSGTADLHNSWIPLNFIDNLNQHSWFPHSITDIHIVVKTLSGPINSFPTQPSYFSSQTVNKCPSIFHASVFCTVVLLLAETAPSIVLKCCLQFLSIGRSDMPYKENTFFI